jgi:hypothetical protein
MRASRIRRLYVICLTLACGGASRELLAGCNANTDPLGPRFRIQFFDYGGAEAGDASNQNSLFRAVMKDKVISWADELRNVASGHDSLPELALIPAGVDNLTSPTAIRNYWTQTHSLELLKGALGLDQGVYKVSSRIYLGELGAPLQRESIAVDMPIKASEFGKTMDAHSIVTYFALAMDLNRRHCDDALVVGVLSRVQEKFADLKRSGPIDQSLVPIEQATKRVIDEIARKPK